MVIRPVPGKASAAICAAAFAAAVVGPAHAADVSQMGLSRAQVIALNAQLTAPKVAPGFTFGSPAGFGAGWGQMFAGIGGQTAADDAPDSVDGAATFGLGFLDPVTAVGLETAATLISVYEGLGEDGNVNFKLHRVLPDRAGVSIGADNAVSWGNAELAEESYYAAFSKVFDLSGGGGGMPWAMVMNVGLGDGRFVDPGDGSVGVFGSVALLPTRQISVIADWTGRDLNAGVSVVPMPRYPVVLTLGATNLTERLGLDVEFAGGVGILHSF